MDAKIIASIIAFCGVGFGALLSSFGYFFRVRRESKRSLRLVLYYLLEIRYAINTQLIDVDECHANYMKRMVEALELRGIPVEDVGPESLISTAVYDHLSNVIGSIRVEVKEELLKGYEESLKLLASEKPVLAYRLKGKEKIQNVAKHTAQYTNYIEKNIFNQFALEGAKGFLGALSKRQKDELMGEISGLLDDDIRLLAKSCGFVEYLKCRAALKRTARLHERFDFSDAREFLDDLLRKVESIATQEAKS